MERISLFLADDHALFREGLGCLVSAAADLTVVAEAGSAAETLRLAPAASAQVIFLDIGFPDRSGIGIVPELREESPSSRVVMLSVHEEPEYLRSSLAAGAQGYVLKSSPFTILNEAIHAVHKGQTFIDPSMREYAVERNASIPTTAVPSATLSQRERQVLIFLSQGLRYQSIAEKLGVSIKTVETYRLRLRQKLGFRSRADIVRFAVETGLITEQPA